MSEKKPALVLNFSRNLGIGETVNASIAFEKEELTKECLMEKINLISNCFDERIVENNNRVIEMQRALDNEEKENKKLKNIQ